MWENKEGPGDYGTNVSSVTVVVMKGLASLEQGPSEKRIFHRLETVVPRLLNLRSSL